MSALPILDRHEMLTAAVEKLSTRGTVDTDLIQTLALLVIAHALNDIASGGLLKEPINSYGEGIGDAIQGQLVRGQAGISQYDTQKR